MLQLLVLPHSTSFLTVAKRIVQLYVLPARLLVPRFRLSHSNIGSTSDVLSLSFTPGGSDAITTPISVKIFIAAQWGDLVSYKADCRIQKCTCSVTSVVGLFNISIHFRLILYVPQVREKQMHMVRIYLYVHVYVACLWLACGCGCMVNYSGAIYGSLLLYYY